MRNLHGSEATCCTTRRADTSLIEATTCNAPADLPEFVWNHAMPACVGTLCDTGGTPFALNWKSTVAGASTRLRNSSKGSATPLTASFWPTGARDGCTRKVRLTGFDGATKKSTLRQLLAQRIATYFPALRKSFAAIDISAPRSTSRFN